jgi:hypothetical protein
MLFMWAAKQPVGHDDGFDPMCFKKLKYGLQDLRVLAYV